MGGTPHDLREARGAEKTRGTYPHSLKGGGCTTPKSGYPDALCVIDTLLQTAHRTTAYSRYQARHHRYLILQTAHRTTAYTGLIVTLGKSETYKEQDSYQLYRTRIPIQDSYQARQMQV